MINLKREHHWFSVPGHSSSSHSKSESYCISSLQWKSSRNGQSLSSRTDSWYELLVMHASVSLDVNIVTTLEEKEGETLRKMVLAFMCMSNVIIFMNEKMRGSASADVILVASSLSEFMEVLTNITWNGPSREVGERDIFKAFRKKTFFSLRCMNVRHHVDKNALYSMSVLKFGWTSTCNNTTVFTVVIKLSAFTDDFVKQSAK